MVNRTEEVIVDGVKKYVASDLLELRASTGLSADEYTIVDGQYKIAHTEDELAAAEELVAKKEQRDIDVSELFVEHEGVLYHANERSQIRIATRLASITDITDVEWKSKDGWVVIKGIELKNVLVKAADLTTSIWKMEVK